MADVHPSNTIDTDEAGVETKDRGMLSNLLGKKKEEEKPKDQAIATDQLEKVHVSEPESKVEEKKPSLLEKLRGSDSSDEEVEEGGEKKIKKKIEEDTHGAVPEEKQGFIEKVKEKLPAQTKNTEEVPPPAEEKKGLIDKAKEKLPGQTKKTEGVPPLAESTPTETHTPEGEKKGILEKIKDKLPGKHSKPEEEKEK